MNIFVLDESPILSAQWQHDRHVVKMILESAQMLSTTVRLDIANTYLPSYFDFMKLGVGNDEMLQLYKSTHVNHPCNIWARESWANFAWLTIHLDSLVAEYGRRFGKRHATDSLRWMFNQIVAKYVGADRFWTRDSERNLVIDPRVMQLVTQHTPFAVCMPDEFKIHTLPSYLQNTGRQIEVYSYRNLYARSKIFQSHVKWTRCVGLPEFLIEPFYSSLVSRRVEELLSANQAQSDSYREYGPLRTTTPYHAPAPIIPYVKPPTNPKALTRFGSK